MFVESRDRPFGASKGSKTVAKTISDHMTELSRFYRNVVTILDVVSRNRRKTTIVSRYQVVKMPHRRFSKATTAFLRLVIEETDVFRDFCRKNLLLN